MRLAIFLVILPVVTVATGAGAVPRQDLGIFFNWGAFQDKNPRKCFAIAQAAGGNSARGRPGSASITSWPARGLSPQLHVRLSRTKRAGSAVIAKIDGRSFQLLAGGENAWAPNAAADAQIVSAIRTGTMMSIESRAEQGGLIRDHYPLRGVATAIDAAVIACAHPNP